MLNLSFQKENPFLFKINDENKVLNKEEFLVSGTPNLYAIYLVASQAKKWFSSLIVELDKEQKFHARSFKESICPEAEAKALNQYNKERKLAYDLLSRWRQDNQDMFEIQYSIPSVATYVGNYNFPTDLVSVEDAIQGYKYANKFLKDTDWTPTAKQPRRVIRQEYKDVYNAAREDIYNSVGFPGDPAIRSTVTEKIVKERTRLCLNRKPYESVESSIVFANHFYNYILTTDFTPEIKIEEEEI